ncbi:peptide MFS transporter [Sandaracinobacteroides saxicola]|uniref:MFS transporter n=1 Tax=Sandaracinobacteroides saxicola TaxID=2759707 RepID=A0A7G5IDX1_9SPHN|nr:oligopeptide:H+ symporter [Sandaracinobacteroides saxicola]QMW21563.1 MFS transporter [Sandaracinobacteroides saxicola]
MALKAWEMFSFAGMRAFLVLYMLATFGFSDSKAALVFGSYGALVLATSLIGGFVADRLIGARMAVTLGAAIIMGGHCGLALETMMDVGSVKLQLFFLSLAAIAAGTGLLKPNVLTMVTLLYDGLGAGRRETGFYAYYLGVNIGGLLAPIVCGYLAAAYGWHWGFGAAAIGMAAGLAVLVGNRHLLPVAATRPALPLTGRRAAVVITGAVAPALVAACWALLQQGVALVIVLGAAFVVGLAYVAGKAPSLPPDDRRMLLPFALLLPSVAMFVMLYEQIGTTITLFAERFVNRELGGVQIATAQIVALNSAFVILAVPVLAWAWARLEQRGLGVPTQRKFVIGFLLLAACFATLHLAAGAAVTGTVALGWIVVAYLLLTLGELSISPVAYAEAGRLAPRSLVGVMLGLFLLAFAAGNLLAGLLAGLADVKRGPLGQTAYADYFGLLAGIAVAWAAVVSVGLFAGAVGKRLAPQP